MATKKKVKKITQAAPAIWKKFSKIERFIWLYFFHQFKVIIEVTCGNWKVLTKEQMEIIASNLACEVIWSGWEIAKEGIIKKVDKDFK